MTISNSGRSPWPARCAYISAAIFIAASGTTNVLYGFSKGDTLLSSVVWAAVAGAVAIVFALSWPALMKSLRAKDWPGAQVAGIALLIAGSYSIVAALGAASGARANAAMTETATADTRAKAQAAYDRAQADLDALATTKPSVELQALIDGARGELAKLAPSRTVGELEALRALAQRQPQRFGCAAVNGSPALSCPGIDGELSRARQRERLTDKIASWTEEIGQAEQRRTAERVRLAAKMDAAALELAKVQPAKVANSDAKALARYLVAVGVEITPDRLNDLLVLLTVLMVEAGGGLSLALGMALSAASEGRQQASTDCPDTVAGTARTPVPDAPAVTGTPTPAMATEAPLQSSAATVRTFGADIMEWLLTCGGRAEGVRALAEKLGRPRSTVSDDCRRLAAIGQLKMTRGARGMVIELAALPN